VSSARVAGLAALGFAIALVAANLRPAFASVGPVLADIGLSGSLAALLTALPVACLGAVSPIAPGLARRWGIERVILGALLMLAAGLVIRASAGTGLLFAGTVLLSGAIAVANVLMPALIKREFADCGGTMTGVYTMALAGFAALAAGVTVPLDRLIGLGWRGALGFWALPAVVALLAWLPFARRPAWPRAEASAPGRLPGPAASGLRSEATREDVASKGRGAVRAEASAAGTAPSAPGRTLLRDPLAWQVTIYFGLQSLSFYAVLSWLPSIYREHGYSPSAAGLVLSVSVVTQMPVALLLPHFAARSGDQRWYAAGCALSTFAGLLGVLGAPTAAPFLWAVLLGLGQGGAFGLGLILFVLRSGSSADTARLSAMAQTFGYLIAAGGPFVTGALREASGSWAVPLVLLLVLTVLQVVAGVLAGRRGYVGASRSSAQ
jgi:MFS transporter, CP family, cyanate transporter